MDASDSLAAEHTITWNYVLQAKWPFLIGMFAGVFSGYIVLTRRVGLESFRITLTRWPHMVAGFPAPHCVVHNVLYYSKNSFTYMCIISHAWSHVYCTGPVACTP